MKRHEKQGVYQEQKSPRDDFKIHFVFLLVDFLVLEEDLSDVECQFKDHAALIDKEHPF